MSLYSVDLYDSYSDLHLILMDFMLGKVMVCVISCFPPIYDKLQCLSSILAYFSSKNSGERDKLRQLFMIHNLVKKSYGFDNIHYDIHLMHLPRCNAVNVVPFDNVKKVQINCMY